MKALTGGMNFCRCEAINCFLEILSTGEYSKMLFVCLLFSYLKSWDWRFSCLTARGGTSFGYFWVVLKITRLECLCAHWKELRYFARKLLFKNFNTFLCSNSSRLIVSSALKRVVSVLSPWASKSCGGSHMIELFVSKCFRFQLTACMEAVLSSDGETRLWPQIWYQNISQFIYGF